MKPWKKEFDTDVNQLANLNDHSGKLVNAHLELKLAKKLLPTVVNQLANLNDHSGKLVSAQLLLKLAKK